MDNLRRIVRLIVGALVAGMIVMADKLSSATPRSAAEWRVIWLLTGVAIGNSLQGSLSQPPEGGQRRG